MATDPVYPDSYRIEAYLTSVWTDLTSDVVRIPITGRWGITGNTAVDLMADTGEMELLLNNQDDEYIPGLATSLAGWNKNTPVRLVIVFDSVEYVIRTYVDQLGIVSGIEQKWVRVQLVDWLEYAAKFPLVSPAIESDKRADEGITTIVAGMPFAPQATSYETGQETFLTIFDTITPKTIAYSEMTKLIKSELGYLYLQKGETLVFEDRHFRNGLRTLDTLPIPTADSGDLLLETGGFLLLETGGHLVLNEAPEDAVIDNSMTDLVIEYGKDVVNRFVSRAYPKGVSASVEVLFSLESPMELGRGQTINFRTNYSDPTGGNQISALSDTMVTPVATTDYLMNTERDGSGSDQTASLVVTPDYGTEGVAYALQNKYAGTAYVIFLQARGKGVFPYSPITDEAEDQPSIDTYGYFEQSIDQRYQQATALGVLRGAAIVEAEKNPRVDLQRVDLIANRSGSLMMAFLNIDVGSLVHIKKDDVGIDDYFYIQGIEFSIELGGLIRFSWIVRGMLSLLSGGLTPVAIEIGGSGSEEGLNFGVAPYIEIEKARTFCAWVYFNNGDDVQSIIHNSSNNNGVVLLSSFGKLRFTSHKIGVAGAPKAGQWTADAAHATGSWIHVGVTYDQSSDPENDPIIYINGSSVAITENVAPSGPYLSAPGVPLTIGALFTTEFIGGAPLTTWELDGKIADARTYKIVLSSADMTTLYNGGDPDSSLLTTGLLFQGPCVRTKDYADLLDTALITSDKLTDNVFGIVGAPEGGEIVRAFP